VKFFLKEKVLAEAAKDKLNSSKIGLVNISEPLIKLRKDEERA
jgi:hypothetical protein